MGYFWNRHKKKIKEREARRVKYSRLLNNLIFAEEHSNTFYEAKAAHMLAEYGTNLLERMETERPEVLPDLVEDLEKLLPALIVLWARDINEGYSQTAGQAVRYSIGLLSRIDVHSRQNIREAVRRIEAAAGPELVEKERVYMWIESGAAFIPPECPRPVALAAE